MKKLQTEDVGSKTKRKSRLQSATTPNMDSRAKFEKENPIPTDIQDPVAYAEKYLEKQIPQAARELEYQLKFGDDKTRKEIALDILSFKGIAKKTDPNSNPVPAVQVIMSGSAPWTQLTVNTKKPELVEGELVNNPKDPKNV